MKKYTVHVTIYPPFQLMYVKSVQSDAKPKKVIEGVIKIGDQYFNSAIVTEYVLERIVRNRNRNKNHPN